MAESSSSIPKGSLTSEPAIRTGIAVRNHAFVSSAQYSDMHFHIEQENIDIPAHRVIVASASPVLDKLINGSGKLESSTRIRVSDITANDFREILRYIYTDEVRITQQSALATLRVANYFDLGYVEERCVEVILSSLNTRNVCAVYSSAYQLNAKLAQKCVQLIQSKTDVLITNGTFATMDSAALKDILRLDQMNVKHEKDIFEALLKWATEYCQNCGLAGTAKNRRHVIGDMLQLVRFTAMSMAEFLDVINMEPAFFSSDEVADIMLTIRVGNTVGAPVLYSNHKRQPIAPTILTSHLFHWQSQGFNYRNFPPEDFVVKSIAPILVHGFGIYGRNGLSVHLAGESKPLALKEIIYDEKTEISKLILEQAIVVTPEKEHTFTAHHDPGFGKFYYFCQMEHKVRPNGFFGYNFGKAYTNKYVRVVEIHYEDLL